MPWTDEDPFYAVACDEPAAFLDAETVQPAASTSRGTAVYVDAEQPEPDETMLLREHLAPGTNVLKSTEMFKAAEKRLKGKDYFEVCFQAGKITAEPRDRYDIMKHWVASAIGYIHDIEGYEPRHAYSLFFPAFEQLQLKEEEEDPRKKGDKRDWPTRLWRLVKSIWSKERAKVVEKQEETEKQVAVKQVEANLLLKGVRSWFANLPENEILATEWAMRRAIVHCGGSHFILRKDGFYGKNPIPKQTLFAQIRLTGMDTQIDLSRPSRTDPDREATYADIMSKHAIEAVEVRALPEKDGGYLMNATNENPTLVVPSFRRNRKLVPTFDVRVDEWLRALAGLDKKGRSLYERFIRQIAAFMAFERGAVPAISLVTPPGAGKKMLIHGLMETLEDPRMASGRDLVADFNENLMYSPFLNVNEGLPRMRYAHSPLDVFRRITAGDVFDVNRKHKSVVSIKNAMRVLLCANNYEIILAFGDGKDLAPDDRKALGDRIVHYEPGEAPCTLLREKGGMAWTKGWIEGDGGEASQFIVAKHFLWLYETYGKTMEPTGAHGFLVEGDPDSLPVELLRTQGGSAPIVMETIVKMTHNANSAMRFLESDDKQKKAMFVLVGGVHDYWRENLSKGSSERLTARRIQNALKGLVVSTPSGLKVKKGKDAQGSDIPDERKWVEIDMSLLYEQTLVNGWTCGEVFLKALNKSVVEATNGTNGTAEPPVHPPVNLFASLGIVVQ